MKKRISMAVLALGCVAVLALSARADTFGPWTPKTAPVSQYDGIYITLGAGGFLQNTPNFNFYTVPNGSALFSAAPDIVGGTGGATLGFALDNRRMSWPGNKPRIEFSFAYGRGSGGTTRTRVIPDVPGGVEFFATTVDGSRTAGFGCGGVGFFCTNTSRLTVAYQSVSGAIRFKTDIHLARNLYITPALGFVGGHSSVDYRIDNITIVSSLPGTVFPDFLKESLKTTRLGGEAAADITWKVNGRWTLHGGASVALFGMGTRLRANDCLDGAGAPAGTPCPGTFASTNFSAFDQNLGARVGMNAGVTYDAGWFRLTLVGQGLWDSDVPGVQNPSSVTTGVSTAPARIVYSSQWRYGGFVSVAFPF